MVSGFRKLSDDQIAELRAWWARREAVIAAQGSLRAKATEYGVSLALVKLVCQNPRYRPTPAELARKHGLPEGTT